MGNMTLFEATIALTLADPMLRKNAARIHQDAGCIFCLLASLIRLAFIL
jgi:hypothetical protein